MVAEPEECGLVETELVEAEEGRTLMAGPEQGFGMVGVGREGIGTDKVC